MNDKHSQWLQNFSSIGYQQGGTTIFDQIWDPIQDIEMANLHNKVSIDVNECKMGGNIEKNQEKPKKEKQNWMTKEMMTNGNAILIQMYCKITFKKWQSLLGQDKNVIIE